MVVPELVFEVRSYSERWPKLLTKVAEYLNAGVTAVCVLDEQSQSALVYTADEPVRIVASSAELTLPEVFADFRVSVSRFFE
jgi:Uma2 family endonuclease